MPRSKRGRRVTVETDLDRAQYATNATTGPWTVPFYFLADAELAVTYTNASGNDTLLTLDVDYTVAGAGDEDGGTITTTQAYAAGGKLVILRDVEFVQPIEYTDGDGFPAKTHERGLDRLTMLAQQLREVSNRTLRFAPSDSNPPQLPSAAARANTILGFNGAGDIVPSIPVSGSAADVLISMAGNGGSSLIGWIRTAASADATTLQKWMGWQEISAFEFMTSAQIADYQAGTMTLDLTAPLQAWATACSTQGIVGRLPKGTPKITSPISLAAAATVRGHGVLSRIAAWGCDAFTVAGDLVTIDSLGLFGYSAGGVSDPKTFSAIHVTGVSGTARNTGRFSNLYLQGWLNPINGEYMVDSTVHNVTTVNCTNGLRLFGQSVNNSVSDSHVVVTGGASILTVKDGAIQGEGLMITGTKLAGGVNAIKSDGFLSIGLDSSCIIDIFSGKAFDLTGVIGFKSEAQWVYSADSCFSFSDAGGATETNACVNPGFATCTGSANLFYWGTNNNGLKLGGCLYSVGGAGYPVSLNGGNADVRSYIKNGTAQAAVRVNTAGNTIEQTGDRSVEWAFSPVATLPSNNALVLPRNGCNTIFISGTTNILSINTAGWDGQEVKLIFQGALTVTDGSNLKLQGNFVTTADDTMSLVCYGANWYELTRSPN